MTLSPFVRDAAERAGKTFVGGYGTYLFEGAITGGTHLPWWHALEFGVGTAVVSAVMSLASRHVGRRDTASLTREVEYIGG